MNFEAVTASPTPDGQTDFCTALFAASAGFKFKNSLEELRITTCPPDIATDEWFESLNDFLNRFPGLKKLSLGGMKLGQDFVFLTENLKKLEVVELPMNGISPSIASNLLGYLNPEVLQELDLGANWIGYEGLRLMKDSFKQFKGLKVLKLNSNKIFKDPHSLDVVEEVFQTFENMEELAIHENSVSEKDFDVLCDVFSEYKNLRVLNISRNNLNDGSILKLVNAMKNGKFMKLEVLDLSFNQIDQIAFEFLVKYLIKNKHPNLKELILRGMSLDKDKDLPLIKELLVSLNSHTFRKLNLKPNNLRKNVKVAFKHKLEDKYSHRLIM